MKWTKPFSYERNYQVQSYTDSAIFMTDLKIPDRYHDDLDKAVTAAKACPFEKLESCLEDIDAEIALWEKMESQEAEQEDDEDEDESEES